MIVEVLVMCFIIFLPTIVAKIRNHKCIAPLFWTNLFLGWSAIAWIPLMLWGIFGRNTQR